MLHRRLVHRFGGEWQGSLHLRVMPAHVLLVVRLAHRLRHGELIVPAKVVCRRPGHAGRLGHILEGSVGMRAGMAVLHLGVEAVGVGDVVEVDVAKLEKIVEVVEVGGNVRHCVEVGGLVHGGVEQTRFAARWRRMGRRTAACAVAQTGLLGVGGSPTAVVRVVCAGSTIVGHGEIPLLPVRFCAIVDCAAGR